MAVEETGLIPDMLPPEINGWICTDPDGLQYQKRKNETAFYMVQMVKMPDDTFVVAYSLIDLDDYTDKIESYVTGYYDSVAQLKETYGEKSNGVIAECIFESLPPIEYEHQWVAKTEAEAVGVISDIIQQQK